MNWPRITLRAAKAPEKTGGAKAAPPGEVAEPTPRTRTLAELLIDYHDICVEHGFQSSTASEFLESHAENPDFVKLARSLDRESADLLMDYYDVCAEYGFNSMKAVEFLKAHSHPGFLRLARGVDRIMMSQSDHRGDQGDPSG